VRDENGTTESGWLNRTVLGAGLTSLLADMAYETATSLLGGFFAILQLPAALLGLVEGAGDALANFVKLAVGYHSDRIGKRKALVVAGYALTGASLALLALGWPFILLGKCLAWTGKGLRGPLRDALLADSVPPEHVGKAFGLHRAGDTVGAVIGPLLGAALVAAIPADVLAVEAAPHRVVFLLTLVPGLGSALVFALMVREQRFTPKPGLRFRESLSELPRPFRRYLVAVGVFGLGDFAHSILVLAATLAIGVRYDTATALVAGPLLYALRNATAAVTAFPVGALGDRVGRRWLLVAGYLLGGAVMLGFAGVFAGGVTTIPVFAGLFGLAGVYVAFQESLEGAMTADLIPDRSRRGTAYGLLGCTNGFGDFVSSLVVGALLAVRPEAAFLYAAGWMFFGAAILSATRLHFAREA
jgi:MFS family permease